MERVELDLIKLSKIYHKNKSKYNYLLCIVEHFSKFAKCLLLEMKESTEVSKNQKIYLKEIGKSELIQSDNCCEFRDKNFNIL